MGSRYDNFREMVFNSMQKLAKDAPAFEDAQMLVGGSEATASLIEQDIYKSIDTEWIDAIEQTLPALDIIVRNPSVAIEDVDEILPVELSRHITDKSIKHLAQHTNFIQDIKDGEVIPQKLLNVYHDETYLTYENKFINTLLARLAAFVDKRYRALLGSCGTERNYKFAYNTEFEHYLPETDSRNKAKISLNIELTAPLDNEENDKNAELNEQYILAFDRLKRINMAIRAYQSSAFAQAMGRQYIRPPVIRTNAILKNKNLKECLVLWEYIESFDKVGYSIHMNEALEKPSNDYIGDLYSSVALQYTNFYYGVVDSEDVRMLSNKKMYEVQPEFETSTPEEELEDYQVYDTEYKKTVPVSRLMNNRKKLSEDEKRMHRAILVALKADEILNEDIKKKEEEMRRLARQRRAEEEARRKAEEEKRKLIASLLEKGVIRYRLRRSFTSRLIQGSETQQDYYTQLKNQLLGYKGVKARTSWKCESFKKGRQHVAKLDIRGKRVYLYLALEPAEFADSKYHFVDITERYPETPMLLKVKGTQGLRYAKELIDLLAERLALKAIEREYEDYRLPYEEDDPLIERGLIKLVLPTGVKLEDGQELTKEDLSQYFDYIKQKEREAKALAEAEAAVAASLAPVVPVLAEEPAPVVEEVPEEPAPAEEPAPIEDGLAVPTMEEVAEQMAIEEQVAESSKDFVAIAVDEDENLPVAVRYRRSFLSRYIQSEELIQDYYTRLKNLALSYKGVKARTSWRCETLKKGKNHLLRFDVRGKRLYVYLAIQPEELENSKYYFTDVRDKQPETPTLIKVRGTQGMRYAVELVTRVMESQHLRKLERADEDFRMPYETDEALIEKGLIKVVAPKGVVLDEGVEITKASVKDLLQK